MRAGEASRSLPRARAAWDGTKLVGGRAEKTMCWSVGNQCAGVLGNNVQACELPALSFC